MKSCTSLLPAKSFTGISHQEYIWQSLTPQKYHLLLTVLWHTISGLTPECSPFVTDTGNSMAFFWCQTAQFHQEIAHFLHNGLMEAQVALEMYLALNIITHDAWCPSSLWWFFCAYGERCGKPNNFYLCLWKLTSLFFFKLWNLAPLEQRETIP